MTFVLRIRRLDGSEGKPSPLRLLEVNNRCCLIIPALPVRQSLRTIRLRIDLSLARNRQRFTCSRSFVRERIVQSKKKKEEKSYETISEGTGKRNKGRVKWKYSKTEMAAFRIGERRRKRKRKKDGDEKNGRNGNSRESTGGWIMQIRAQLQLERGELTGESSLVERERGYGVARGI